MPFDILPLHCDKNEVYLSSHIRNRHLSSKWMSVFFKISPLTEGRYCDIASIYSLTYSNTHYHNENILEAFTHLHWSGGSEICEGKGVSSQTLWQNRTGSESLPQILEVSDGCMT